MQREFFAQKPVKNATERVNLERLYKVTQTIKTVIFDGSFSDGHRLFRSPRGPAASG